MHPLRSDSKGRNRLKKILTVSIWALLAPISLSSGRSQVGERAAEAPQRITVNDNRVPAGTLADRTLTVRLEARSGEWHPDRASDPGVVVKASTALAAVWSLSAAFPASSAAVMPACC